MDGGAWWAAVHAVAESDTTERLTELTDHVPPFNIQVLTYMSPFQKGLPLASQSYFIFLNGTTTFLKVFLFIYFFGRAVWHAVS